MRVAGQVTIQDAPSGQAERSMGRILVLVHVAIMTARLLAVPRPDQAAVGYDLTVMPPAGPALREGERGRRARDTDQGREEAVEGLLWRAAVHARLRGC